MNVKSYLVKLNPEDREALAPLAEAQDTSVSFLIRQSIRDYLERHMKRKEGVMTLHEEIDGVPKLRIAGKAVIEYAEGLSEGQFMKERHAYVMRDANRDANFVALRIQHQNQAIFMSLRGHRQQLDPDGSNQQILPLKRGRPSYSECWLAHPRQLKAALDYLERAHGVWKKKR